MSVCGVILGNPADDTDWEKELINQLSREISDEIDKEILQSFDCLQYMEMLV